MKLKMLVVAGALLAAAPAAAHDAKSLHGGRVVLAGNFHIEMVVKDGAIEIYAMDHHNKPVPLAGFKGVAIMSIDGKSERIVLEADNARLIGKSAGALPAQPKGVVQLTQPDGKSVQARFN